ncbi:MAG TPA: hypothetical protein VFG73_08645 [Rhodanobacteraceae bacterium]|nr:hypothetical protein [Rhodanobacteraceae bacterium]
MEVKNNPAGRLYDILELARRQNPKQPARKAWAAVFEIESADTGTLLQMLADLLKLVHETKTAIQRLDNVDQELHLRPFRKIEGLLSNINLDASWENWQNKIDDTTLYGLQFSSDRLSRISGFTQLDSDEIVKLRSVVDELFNSVVDSALPSELKMLLLRNLESIRLSLAAYRIRGIEGIHEEIERSLGSVLLHQDEIQKSSSKERSLWESFFDLVKRLNQVVSLARTGQELAAPAILALAQMLHH